MKLHVKANDRNSILKDNLVKPLDAATKLIFINGKKNRQATNDLTVKDKYFIRYKGKTMIKHRKNLVISLSCYCDNIKSISTCTCTYSFHLFS